LCPNNPNTRVPANTSSNLAFTLRYRECLIGLPTCRIGIPCSPELRGTRIAILRSVDCSFDCHHLIPVGTRNQTSGHAPDILHKSLPSKVESQLTSLLDYYRFGLLPSRTPHGGYPRFDGKGTRNLLDLASRNWTSVKTRFTEQNCKLGRGIIRAFLSLWRHSWLIFRGPTHVVRMSVPALVLVLNGVDSVIDRILIACFIGSLGGDNDSMIKDHCAMEATSPWWSDVNHDL